MSTQTLLPGTRPHRRTGVIHFNWISKAAAKQVSKLDNATREKVLESLNGKRWEVCTPVYGRGWRNVWHYPIDASVRVTFSQKAGETVVWDVGKHDKFEDFADHGDRFRSTQRYPIKEFLMKAQNQAKISAATESATQSKSPQTITCSPEHMLGQALLQAVAPLLNDPVSQLRDQLSSYEMTLLKLESEVVSAHEDIRQRLVNQTQAAQATEQILAEQFSLLRDASQDNLQRACKTIRSELVADIGVLAANLDDQRTRVTAAEAGNEQRLLAFDEKLSTHAEGLQYLRNMVYDLGAELDRQVSLVHAQLTDRLQKTYADHRSAHQSLADRVALLERQSVRTFLDRLCSGFRFVRHWFAGWVQTAVVRMCRWGKPQAPECRRRDESAVCHGS